MLPCSARSFAFCSAAVFSSLILLYFFFFFFSSRRRHTRCLSDWSSDVCSSDLLAAALPLDVRDRGREPFVRRGRAQPREQEALRHRATSGRVARVVQLL